MADGADCQWWPGLSAADTPAGPLPHPAEPLTRRCPATRHPKAPIQVTLGPGFQPVRFRWRGQVHQVAAVLDMWTELDFAHPWWEAGAYQDPPQIEVWRVQTETFGLFDLGRGADRSWRLLNIWD